jgi:RND family efflux transporter MFP subunit
MKGKIIPILMIIGALMTFGCNKSKRKTKTENDKPASVFIKKISPENITDKIKISGRLQSLNKVDLISEVSGNIAKINKNLGDYVIKGDSLGKLKENDFILRLNQAKATLKSNKFNFEVASKSKNAAEKLFKSKSISFAEYNQSLSNWNTAKSALEMAKSGLETAQRNYNNSIFLAPISGYIAYLPIIKGQHINPGQEVCRIVQTKKLRLAAGISEKDILNIGKGNKVEVFYKPLNLILSAKVTGCGKDLIPNKNFYPIEIEVDNQSEKLLPGMIVEATIYTVTHNNTVILPVDAIEKYFDTNFVYIVSKNKTAIKKEIKIEKVIDNKVVVKSGIKFGDKVIVSGTEDIKNGTKLKINAK